MTDKLPAYVLATVIIGGARMKRFRHEGPDAPGRVLEDPPSFRWAGFDLKTLDSAHFVEDSCLEVRSGDRKVIQLHQNSLLVARMAADGDFLGWGKRADTFERQPTLNPIACVEIHAAFCHLYAKLLSFADKPDGTIRMHAGLRNAKVGENYLALTPYYPRPGRVFVPERFPAHSDNADADETMPAADLLANPSAAAYKLLSSFAEFFDIPVERLGLCRDGPQGKEIDIDALINLQ